MIARYASLIAASFALPFSVAAAPACRAVSGPQATAVLELYTSEGCNSCPPADKWVSSLPGSGFTADKVIPLAFHVDYWDYIGWKDVYASPIFTERQRWLIGVTWLWLRIFAMVPGLNAWPSPISSSPWGE